MPRLDRTRLESLIGVLALSFYALLVLALVAVVGGSPGAGLVYLVFACCAHVGRVGAEASVRPGLAARPI
jgi:Flp pilus assembly protein TadB